MGRPHATSSGVSPTITTSVPRNVRPVSALARAAATAGRSDRRDESEPYAPTRKRAGSSPADSSFSAAPTARLPVSSPTSARPAASGGPKAASNSATPAISFVDRKSTRLNSSHGYISYAVFCLKKKKQNKKE